MKQTYAGASARRIAWGGPGAAVPPMPLFMVAFAAGLWCDRSIPWPVQAGAFVELFLVVGAALAAAGVLVFASGLVTFARANTGILLQRSATRVVTAGPYRWSRNPMYVSFVALYIGGALLANTIWPLVFLPIAIALLVRLVIEREERYMHDTFGQDYGEYTRRVPRWF